MWLCNARQNHVINTRKLRVIWWLSTKHWLIVLPSTLYALPCIQLISQFWHQTVKLSENDLWMKIIHLCMGPIAIYMKRTIHSLIDQSIIRIMNFHLMIYRSIFPSLIFFGDPGVQIVVLRNWISHIRIIIHRYKFPRQFYCNPRLDKRSFLKI